MIEVADGYDNVIWSYKETSDDYASLVTGEGGKNKTVTLPKKRMVTYRSKLTQADLRDKQAVREGQAFRLTAAKRSDYGDSEKFVTFATIDSTSEVLATQEW